MTEEIAFRVEACGAGRCAAAMAERLGRKDDRGLMPHVQRLFPEFDADQREFFITGMLPGELDFEEGDGT